MNEIKPNQWYTLYQLFGDSLLSIDRINIKESLIRGLDLVLLQYDVIFKTKKFGMRFDRPDFSLNNLEQTRFGKPIYFPIDRASYDDSYFLFKFGKSQSLRSPKFVELEFYINASEEDLMGKYFNLEDDLIGTIETARDYKYRLNLKSENGIFVSEEPATFDEEGLPFVSFAKWKTINSEIYGVLYVPPSYNKLVTLEIMLEEKK